LVQIIAADGGNFRTKVVHSRGYDSFSSAIGEWNNRKAGDIHSSEDMDFHIVNKYDNFKGFAGPLASLESEYGGSMYGTSKNHEDARIRILLGIARNLFEPVVNVIVGQPYTSHTDIEKKEIIDSLKGEHQVTINGKLKEFNISDVLVGIEGAMAFWSQPHDGAVNLIDVGSGTVNCIHFLNKRIVDRKSDTLPFGSETSKTSVNHEGMAGAIFKNMSKSWNKNDLTLLCGGSAKNMLNPLKKYYPNIKLIEPTILVSESISTKIDSGYANAAGMYNVAVKYFGQLQTR
jgi:plasmid segregation protein ParM